jgi:lipopolysaccharide transport system ATP-binding protein
MSVEIAVKADNLSKCYQIYDSPRDRLRQMLTLTGKRHYREFWALKNVSLEVGKGEAVAIIGSNGSGKSTLLQLISGTIAPTGGTAQTHGRIAALLELGSGFNLEFTGRENVYMNCAIFGLTHEEIDARFAAIEAFAGIGEFIDQPAKTYSSGMVVRLAFAVSVCVEPDVLIVDEALAVGDASFQFKCLNRLATLTEQGTTLLFVSHDMSMVKKFCQHALYLRQGEVRATGSPDEITELYLLDTRDEQRRSASGGATTVTLKSSMEKQKGIAFGTDEGHIVSACFTNTQDLHSSYVHGEEIEMRVAAAHRDSVMQPNISFTIQEPRLLVVGGKNFALQSAPAENGWQKTFIGVRFRANLSPGRYHVTVKLLNGITEDTSQLIEKRVALLTFDIVPNDKSFLGIVDLGLEQTLCQPPID